MTRWEQLRFLIGELQHEMPEYGHYAVPQDEREAFDLFRALCNVRPPGPASAEFLAVEHELLQAVTAAKGITEAADLAPTKLDARLALWQGDITTLRCDAIVNAANSQLCGCFRPLHGCIDNIIHTMAGVELREHCARLMREQGIGPKVANCVVLFGLYHLEAFPIDVWIKRALKENFPKGFDPTTLGEYAGLAQQYIFYYARSHGK